MAAQASGEEVALQRANIWRNVGISLHSKVNKQLPERKQTKYSNHERAGTWNQGSRATVLVFFPFFAFNSRDSKLSYILFLKSSGATCSSASCPAHCTPPPLPQPSSPCLLLPACPQDHRRKACPRHKQDSHLPHSQLSTSTLPREEQYIHAPCSQWACILVLNHVTTFSLLLLPLLLHWKHSHPSLCCSEIAGMLSSQVVLQEKPAGLHSKLQELQACHCSSNKTHCCQAEEERHSSGSTACRSWVFPKLSYTTQ